VPWVKPHGLTPANVSAVAEASRGDEALHKAFMSRDGDEIDRQRV
jgi:hypothetical protein